jgi:hypothetical protein
MSQPGHHQRYEAIGEVRLVHRRPTGAIAGVLLHIDVGEAVEIAVLAPTWPAGVCPGVRLWVKGTVQREPMDHRKNSHFVLATHVELVPGRRTAS